MNLLRELILRAAAIGNTSTKESETPYEMSCGVKRLSNVTVGYTG
jgi:hypothetical protein